MGNSLSFNGTDLSQYGLTIAKREVPLEFSSEGAQLQYKAYATSSLIIPSIITLNISVTGASLATLKTNLDSIKQVLGNREDAKLILDSLTDRYWWARFQSLTGVISGLAFIGNLSFIAYDSFAYDVDETTHTYDAGDFLADPQTLVLTVGGTTRTEPLYTFTAAEALNAITLKLENLNTDMELQWEGSLANTDTLKVNVASWVVLKNDVADMAISGAFPYLIPGSNSIKVTAFGTSSALTIVYRKRYL